MVPMALKITADLWISSRCVTRRGDGQSEDCGMYVTAQTIPNDLTILYLQAVDLVAA